MLTFCLLTQTFISLSFIYSGNHDECQPQQAAKKRKFTEAAEVEPQSKKVSSHHGQPEGDEAVMRKAPGLRAPPKYGGMSIMVGSKKGVAPVKMSLGAQVFYRSFIE